MPEFAPCVLYHPSRGVADPELVESQEMYDFLMSQGGWVDTPAAFGVITAPNREQQIVLRVRAQGDEQPQAVGVAAVSPSVVPGASAEKVDKLASEIEVLHKMLAKQAAAVQDMQQQLAVAMARFDAMEEAEKASTVAPDRGGRK